MGWWVLVGVGFVIVGVWIESHERRHQRDAARLDEARRQRDVMHEIRRHSSGDAGTGVANRRRPQHPEEGATS